MAKFLMRPLAAATVVALSVPLTGCFPEGFSGLPLTDRSLSSESPEGIWMILTEENSTSPNADDATNPFLYQGMSRELVVVTANEDGIYEMTRCDSAWRKDFSVEATADGYEATFTETGSVDESGVTPQTLTDLTVTYGPNFRTLNAEGSRVTTPVGESTTLTVEGVKVSDSTDFATAPELTYEFSLDYTNLGTAGIQEDAVAECIAIAHGVETTEQTDDVWEFTQDVFTFFDTSDRQVQYYRFRQEVGEQVTNSLGATINTESVFTLYVNACAETEAACNDAAQWTETSSNTLAGVAFDINYEVVDNTYVINPLALTPWTAFLWPHDGDFMHANISVTIDDYQQFAD
jgi:hypothetical protein